MLLLQWDSNLQSMGCGATEHLRNRVRKENLPKTSLRYI